MRDFPRIRSLLALSTLSGMFFFSGCGGTPPRSERERPQPLPQAKRRAATDPQPSREQRTSSEPPAGVKERSPKKEGMELPPPLPPLHSRKLSNGLLVALSRDKSDPRDRILVFFPRRGQKTPAGMAGIQELADRLIQRRLEQALEPEGMGEAEAALSTRTLPGGMVFEVAGRRGKLKRAQKTLIETLMDPRVDPSEIPRLRAELLMDLAKDPRRRLALAFVSRVLGLGLPFPDTIQEDIAGIQPAALSLYLKMHYRPQGAIVLLQGGGWNRNDLRDLGNDLLAWKDGGLSQPPPPPKIPFFSFAGSPQFSEEGELLVLLPSPSIEDSGSPLSELCWQIFCLDGLGGRLAKELEARGIPHARIQPNPLGPILGARLLSLTAPGVEPAALIAAVRAAVASLAENSPSLGAFDQAKRRVLVSWDRKMNPPSLRAETLARALSHGLSPSLDLGVLRALQALRPDDIPEAASLWLKPAFLYLSSRTQAPKGAVLLGKRDFREKTESSLGTTIIQNLPGKPEEWEERKKHSLAKARRALGLSTSPQKGSTKTLRFEVHGKLLASLPFQEKWIWDFGQKKVEEELRILKTRIRRSFGPKGAREVLDHQARTLGELEAESYLQSGLLNPLILLHPDNPFIKTIQAQGRIRLKEGKDLILLRFHLAIGPIESKVSLGIDPDTGLPRRLLYQAPSPGGSRVRTIYLLQEYRMEKGIRFPHTLFRFDRGAYRGELSLK